jgi:hypothetical protein
MLVAPAVACSLDCGCKHRRIDAIDPMQTWQRNPVSILYERRHCSAPLAGLKSRAPNAHKESRKKDRAAAKI